MREGLVVEADVVDLRGRQATLLEAVGDGAAGELVVVLLAGEPLFLRRRHDAAVDDQGGGRVVIVGGDAENGAHDRWSRRIPDPSEILFAPNAMNGTPDANIDAKRPPVDQRVLIQGINWAQYEAFLAMRGEAATPRVAYLRGGSWS